jgi:hypothetical protein
VRVYVPSTTAALSRLQADRQVPGGAACAVTPALREWYAEGGEDELEYVALMRAARRSLTLLTDEVRAARRRVVLAADVPDGAVLPGGEDDRADVRLTEPVPIGAIQAIHIDDLAVVPLVRAALIDPGDEMVQGDLDDADLLWFATQELDDLLAT